MIKVEKGCEDVFFWEWDESVHPRQRGQNQFKTDLLLLVITMIFSKMLMTKTL